MFAQKRFAWPSRGKRRLRSIRKFLITAEWLLTDRLARSRISGLGSRATRWPAKPAKAKIAYQDFLGLWKDADSDIPILKQAKSEYASLH